MPSLIAPVDNEMLDLLLKKCRLSTPALSYLNVSDEQSVIASTSDNLRTLRSFQKRLRQENQFLLSASQREVRLPCDTILRRNTHALRSVCKRSVNRLRTNNN